MNRKNRIEMHVIRYGRMVMQDHMQNHEQKAFTVGPVWDAFRNHCGIEAKYMALMNVQLISHPVTMQLQGNRESISAFSVTLSDMSGAGAAALLPCPPQSPGHGWTESGRSTEQVSAAAISLNAAEWTRVKGDWRGRA